MSDAAGDQGRRARRAMRRVARAARAGQARLGLYRQQAGAGLLELRGLGAWLRTHLFRQIGKGRRGVAGRLLRRAVMARRLPQRQEVHRNADQSAGVAAYARQRVAQVVQRRKR